MAEISTSEFIIFFILGPLVFLVLSLLLREFFAWYWKINKIVMQQQEQIELTKELIGIIKDTEYRKTSHNNVSEDAS